MTAEVAKSKKGSDYYYKLFRVKRKDGRVTTVSVDPILVTRACQVLGGLKAVSKAVREVAITFDDSMYKNCSGFVSEELRKQVTAGLAARKAATTAATPELAVS